MRFRFFSVRLPPLQMNLASPAVLEGLNACLDHRQEVFVPELARTFRLGSTKACARFFATQNPVSMGGARRALPQSFVNRFTSVQVAPMSAHEQARILERRMQCRLPAAAPNLSKLLPQMVASIDKLISALFN